MPRLSRRGDPARCRSGEAARLQLAAGGRNDARTRRRARPLPARAPGSRCRSYGPGMASASGLFGREAEAPVVRRVADQQDRPVAEPARLARWRGASAPRRCRRSSATDRRRAARAAGPACRSRPPRPTASPCRRCAHLRRVRRTPALPTACGRGAAAPTICACARAPWRGRAAPRAPECQRQFRRRWRRP